MPFRNIFISSPAKLSIQHSQLKVEGVATQSVPIEDINAILIENMQVQLNAYVLQKLGKEGVCIFICDEKHMPCVVLMGYKTHFHHTKMLHLQLSASKPFQKKIWQSVIRQKIRNQAVVLEWLEREESFSLRRKADSVQSGDAGNVEAAAAAQYFSALFGGDFTRNQATVINAALNYGYAIIRGLICRSLVMHGLDASIGIFHKNMLNAFNLADDLIEPFRPIVDYFVASHLGKLDEELTPEIKHALFSLSSVNVKLDGELYAVHYAITRVVQCISKALKNNLSSISLPQLVPLEYHKYE